LPGGRLRLRRESAESTLNEYVDDDAIFCVHANESARLPGGSHRLENGSIINKKNSRVRHEQLEAGNALGDKALQFRQAMIGQVGNDQMKAVIDTRFTLGFREPGIEGLIQGLAMILHSEVDDRRGTTERGCASTCFEIIRRRCAAEW